MPEKRDDLCPGDAYGWKLIGRGNASVPNEGEPNYVISAWDLEISDLNDNDEKVLLGKLSFSLVNQGTACNHGIDLSEACDAEDDFHCDYYEHVVQTDRDRKSFENLLLCSRAILIKDEDLAAIASQHRLDALLILDQVFNDALVVVHCADESAEVATQLASVMDKMSRLPGDGPKEAWLYHDDRFQWTIAADPREQAS